MTTAVNIRHNTDGSVVRTEVETAPSTRAPRVRPAPPVSTAVVLDRMTAEEYGGIIAWAAAELVNGNPQPSLWLDKFRVASAVNVGSDGFKAAAAAIVKAGKMTPERAAIVFSAL